MVTEHTKTYIKSVSHLIMSAFKLKALYHLVTISEPVQ